MFPSTPYRPAQLAALGCLLGVGALGPLRPRQDRQDRMRGTLDASRRPKLIFVQAPAYAPHDFMRRYPKGSRIVSWNWGKSHTVSLTSGFFAARDPQISFHARRILFAVQRVRGSRWQIWEMDPQGTHLVQVTHCRGNCLRPAYLSRRAIVYTAIPPGRQRLATQLYVSRRNGMQAHRITFGPGGFRLQTLLHSGRLLVSARWPLTVHGSARSRELYTLHPDGTELMAVRYPRGRAVRAQAMETGHGDLIFVRYGYHAGRWNGRMAKIVPGRLHAAAYGATAKNIFTPHPMGPHRLLVARRPMGGHLALYVMNALHLRRGQRIYADRKLDSLDAVALQPHPMPWHYWSILKLLNPAAYKKRVGQLMCLNSNLSLPGVRRRTLMPARSVRVLERRPLGGPPVVLGTAPVAADGSFYLRAPADQPLRFQLLDAASRVLATQRSWIWVRPDEQRGCFGCHASQALAPPDHWPLILRRRHDSEPSRLGSLSRASR